MAIKGYSTFPKAPLLLDLYHQIVLCHNLDTLWGSLTLLQRCNQCIFQPQQTESHATVRIKLYFFKINNKNFAIFILFHLIKQLNSWFVAYSLKCHLQWPLLCQITSYLENLYCNYSLMLIIIIIINYC